MNANYATILKGGERAVIVAIQPEVDGGRYPIKRIVGDCIVVEATVVADGHDVLQCVLLVRKNESNHFLEIPMKSEANDRWRAEFTVDEIGEFHYTIEAWLDPFLTWQRDLRKRIEANQDVRVDLLSGAILIQHAKNRAEGKDAETLGEFAASLTHQNGALPTELALSGDVTELMKRYPDRHMSTLYDKELVVIVDPPLARFGAWYEFFPRSCSPSPETHGTFKDAEQTLPDVAEMGFDVVYLPPIHPIGETNRKGINNSTRAMSQDVGSPWAIGSKDGGHKSIHPKLGTFDDFHHFVKTAHALNLEVALDIAFQCSPDHPYVKDHPEWFRKRPDGTIQYAENPPKKYEDIYPFEFDTFNYKALWEELKSTVDFWVEQGIHIFRVDNPHTKPLAFWEWLIGTIKKDHPETVFLAEAFTRPTLMYQLAKAGFTQSYVHFPWQNKKHELEHYFTETLNPKTQEYLRASAWPNTPDILTEYLQSGGRAAFIVRFILAATLSATYGIYGPPFELCENKPWQKGSEEYFHSEKYEIKHWDLKGTPNLRSLIRHVNLLRKSNQALQRDENLRFHATTNDYILCYSKTSADDSNTIVIVVNLDPHHTQAAMVDLSIAPLESSYKMHDLLAEETYIWKGTHNFVELNPSVMSAHIFRVEK